MGALATPGFARIDAYLPLPAILLQRGVDLRQVLDAAAVRPDIFDDPDNLISYHDAGRLLAVSAQLAGCDHLGLLVGERSRLCNMGLAGQIAVCMDTAGQGLQTFADFFSLQNTAATVSLLRSGEYSRLVYAIAEPGMHDTAQLQLGAMALASNILQDLCGPDCRPTVVTFAIGAPSNLRPCHQFFRAPLRFDWGETALVFESRWLERPLRHVTALVRRRVQAEVRRRQAAILGDFPTSFRRVLRRQLVIGKFSMDSIATGLGMHRRTLDRRLTQHGLKYGEVLESVLCDTGSQLLRDTDLPVRQVAEALHYANSANFAAAFRRWNGMTPSEYRKQVR